MNLKRIKELAEAVLKLEHVVDLLYDIEVSIDQCETDLGKIVNPPGNA